MAVTETSIPQDDFAASTSTTGKVAVGGTATGEINAAPHPKVRDRDWFAVELKADKTYRIEVRGADSSDGTLADPILVGVYDKDGKYIAGTGDDNSGLGRNALTVLTPNAAGTHYVAVQGHGTATGTDRADRLEGLAGRTG